jgi:CubicO group peptidase (beta-lactamase class C family)
MADRLGWARGLLIPMLFALALPSGTRAQALDAKAVDELLRDALKSWDVPGVAVAIVRDDRVIYLKGHGVRDLGSRAPMTPDTVVPLASCTKAFTTTAMAMLVDEGKMDWDDPVRKHIPFFRLSDPLADANVTLRDLVTHRTGLRGHDFLWYRSPWTDEEILHRIAFVKPSRSFRSAFQYQSIMFMAAGWAVGTASHSRWEEFVQKRLVEPLGMTSTSFTTTTAQKAADHASPHRRNGQGAVEVIPWYAMERPNPAGSVNASARDLTRWLQLHLGDGVFQGKRLVSATNLAQTHAPQTIIPREGLVTLDHPETNQISYAMGWIVQDYRGQLLLSHGGAIDGFRAHITLVPHSRLGIAILSNLDDTRMNLAVSNSLVDVLLGLPYKDWNAYYTELVARRDAAEKARRLELAAHRHPDTNPSRTLQAYTGSYEHPAYGEARVELHDGGLVWRWSNFRCRLEHFHFDTFTVKSSVLKEPFLVFTLGTDGDVATLTVLEVEFKKKRGERSAKGS